MEWTGGGRLITISWSTPFGVIRAAAAEGEGAGREASEDNAQRTAGEIRRCDGCRCVTLWPSQIVFRAVALSTGAGTSRANCGRRRLCRVSAQSANGVVVVD